MLGYADQWLSELSGLSQADNSIAWQIINFSPTLISNLTNASNSYRTIRGLASAKWTLLSTSFTYDIVVPVGATGRVTLDLQKLGFSTLTESGVILSTKTRGEGIIKVTMTNSTVLVQVPSGLYKFIAF